MSSDSERRHRWHVHFDVRCSRCSQQVWPRATCASKERAEDCAIPKIAVCPACRKLDTEQVDKP